MMRPAEVPHPHDGVILAAGFGSRLGGGTFELKPLTPVGGVPLLIRAVRSLEVAGCRSIVVVLGHGAEEVAAALAATPFEATVSWARNDRPHLANGVSALIGAERVGPTFVLTMADHVLGDEVARLAGGHRPPEDGATLLVDRRIDQVFDLDDATKVATEGNLIRRIGKTLATYDAVDTGVFVCTQALTQALRDELSVRGDVSLSQGVQRLADRSRMHALDVGEGDWQDVDTPAMLAHAEAMLARTRPPPTSGD